MFEEILPHLDRRNWLTGAIGLAGASSLSATSAIAKSAAKPVDKGARETITFSSPEEEFHQFIRMAYGLEERQTVYWAQLTYNYFKPGGVPVPIFAKEAVEVAQAKKMRPNMWQIQVNDLSFPRDIETGALISEFRDPISGKMVPAPSAKVFDDDKGLIFTPQGALPVGRKAKPEPLRLTFRHEREYVTMLRIRVPPSSFRSDWPRDFIELGTQRVLASDFYNPAVKTLTGTASATFLLPALQRWLPIDKAPDMAGGYIVVHVDSLMLKSVADLPAEFHQRAAELGHADVLRIDPARFRMDP